MYIKQAFVRAIQQDRLAHAYLLEGMSGVGKAAVVEYATQALYCSQPSPEGAPCLECNHCQRIAHRQFVDFIEIEAEGSTIKVEQIRSLQHTLSQASMEGGKRVCVIYHAEKMTASSSNSLLKILEEPETDVLFFLLTDQIQRILPTIRSRCQVLLLPPLRRSVFVEKLIEKQVSSEMAMFLSYLTNSLETAEEWSKDEGFLQLKKASAVWFDALVTNPRQAFLLVQTDLMEWLTSKEKAILFLEMCICYTRDMMVLSHQYEEMAQPTQATRYERYRMLKRKDTWTSWMNEWYQATFRLQSNVSIQSVFESIAVRVKQQEEGERG